MIFVRSFVPQTCPSLRRQPKRKKHNMVSIKSRAFLFSQVAARSTARYYQKAVMDCFHQHQPLQMAAAVYLRCRLHRRLHLPTTKGPHLQSRLQPAGARSQRKTSLVLDDRYPCSVQRAIFVPISQLPASDVKAGTSFVPAGGHNPPVQYLQSRGLTDTWPRADVQGELDLPPGAMGQ